MDSFSEKNHMLEQYMRVKNQIIGACKKAGRDPGSVTLVIVSKFQPKDRIRWLLDASERNFAESRTEELDPKWEELLSDYKDVNLHYIGQLQSRKIKQIVKYCNMIHSLDRIEIAEKIGSECSKQNKQIECMIQINTGNEPQKGGIHPDLLSNFIASCKMISPLIIKGIMCIPPHNQDPVPHFQLMQKLKNDFGLPELSMGMSNDFQEAIFFGATMVRIGTRIMGERL